MATGAEYHEWRDLLVAISHDDHFEMTGVERGTVFSLLASPPATLSGKQLDILAGLKSKWEAHQNLNLR